jgi:lysozyme
MVYYYDLTASMVKRASTSRTLLKLGIVMLVIGIMLMLTINTIRYFWPAHNQKTSNTHKSFGIIVPAGYSVHGIDVSRHQGLIHWKKVDTMNSGGKVISFAFIKASEGITKQDPTFEQNWKALRKTDILRGAYHFYYPSRDAIKQARNFISQVSLEKGDLPPVVDIEHSGGKNRKNICKGLTTFLDELEKKYKVKPIIYTNLSFYNDNLAGEFDEYPLWISCYFDHDRFYSSCNHKWTFWQHSEKGYVNGIKGYVDFNVFKSNILELRKLCLK